MFHSDIHPIRAWLRALLYLLLTLYGAAYIIIAQVPAGAHGDLQQQVAINTQRLADHDRRLDKIDDMSLEKRITQVEVATVQLQRDVADIIAMLKAIAAAVAMVALETVIRVMSGIFPRMAQPQRKD